MNEDKTLARKQKQIENLKKQIDALELKKSEKGKYVEYDKQIEELKLQRDSLKKVSSRKKQKILNSETFN